MNVNKQTDINKHLWSEFKHVSTTITHQFMIYTQLIKNHQNNLSTTATMNSSQKKQQQLWSWISYHINFIKIITPTNSLELGA